MERYKHICMNLMFDQMMEDLDYIKKHSILVNIKKNNP